MDIPPDLHPLIIVPATPPARPPLPTTLGARLGEAFRQVGQAEGFAIELVVAPFVRAVARMAAIVTVESRQRARSHRRYPLHRRTQMVCAKRRHLGLPPLSGKLPGLTRKQSYALASARLSTSVDKGRQAR